MQGEPGWGEAYKRWLAGKNPTDDPGWKEGVFGAYCELIIPHRIVILGKK
jgi:hypothetical protein